MSKKDQRTALLNTAKRVRLLNTNLKQAISDLEDLIKQDLAKSDRSFIHVKSNGFTLDNLMADLQHNARLLIPLAPAVNKYVKYGSVSTREIGVFKPKSIGVDDLPGPTSKTVDTAKTDALLEPLTKNGGYEMKDVHNTIFDNLSDYTEITTVDGTTTTIHHNEDREKTYSKCIFTFSEDDYKFNRRIFRIPVSKLAPKNKQVVADNVKFSTESTQYTKDGVSKAYGLPSEIIMKSKDNPKCAIFFTNVNTTKYAYTIPMNGKYANLIMSIERIAYGEKDTNETIYRSGETIYNKYISLWSNDVSESPSIVKYSAQLDEAFWYLPVPSVEYGMDMIGTTWECTVIWRADKTHDAMNLKDTYSIANGMPEILEIDGLKDAAFVKDFQVFNGRLLFNAPNTLGSTPTNYTWLQMNLNEGSTNDQRKYAKKFRYAYKYMTPNTGGPLMASGSFFKYPTLKTIGNSIHYKEEPANLYPDAYIDMPGGYRFGYTLYTQTKRELTSISTDVDMYTKATTAPGNYYKVAFIADRDYNIISGVANNFIVHSLPILNMIKDYENPGELTTNNVEANYIVFQSTRIGKLKVTSNGTSPMIPDYSTPTFTEEAYTGPNTIPSGYRRVNVQRIGKDEFITMIQNISTAAPNVGYERLGIKSVFLDPDTQFIPGNGYAVLGRYHMAIISYTSSGMQVQLRNYPDSADIDFEAIEPNIFEDATNPKITPLSNAGTSNSIIASCDQQYIGLVKQKSTSTSSHSLSIYQLKEKFSFVDTTKTCEYLYAKP